MTSPPPLLIVSVRKGQRQCQDSTFPQSQATMLKVRVVLGYKQKWRWWPSLDLRAAPCQLDLEVAVQSPKSQSPVSKGWFRRCCTIPSTSPSPPFPLSPPHSFSHNKSSLLINASKRCLGLEEK